MVANAGRLELGRALAIAQRLSDAATTRHPDGRMSEAIALAFLRDEWGFNRLGLDDRDRGLLERLGEAGGDGVSRTYLDVNEDLALGYLLRLDLVEEEDGKIRLTRSAQQSGRKLWSVR